MWMRRPAWVPAVAFLVVVSGCSAQAPDEAPTAAVVLPFLDDRFGDMAEVLSDRLEDAGYTVTVSGSDGDIPAQVQTVRDAIDSGVDALVVWPIDATSLTPVIDDAHDGTFVVSIGDLVRDTVQLDEWVTFDAAEEGRLQAQALVDGLGLAGATGPVRIELFAGSPDDPRSEESYGAAMGVLKPYFDSGVLTVGSGETSLDDVSILRGTGSAAESRLTRILRESYAGGFPDAVLAPSDEIARGAAAALMAAGAVPAGGFPLITGRGAQLRSLAALIDGRQFLTLLEDPRRVADVAADRVIADATDEASDAGPAIDNGAVAVLTQFVDPIPVRAADIDEVVVDSGYWSRDRVDEAIAEYGLPAS